MTALIDLASAERHIEAQRRRAEAAESKLTEISIQGVNGLLLGRARKAEGALDELAAILGCTRDQVKSEILRLTNLNPNYWRRR